MMIALADPVTLERTIDQIESLDPAAIRAVVDRIPDSHLSEEDGRSIIEGLVDRRSRVRQAFATQLSGGGT